MNLNRLPWGRILLIAALLAPVGWAIARALSPPRDLYSRYERHVLWQIDNSRPGFFRRLLKLPPCERSFDLASLEEEYGDDPRYWQLLIGWDEYGLLDDARTEEVMQAIDRGTYDAATFEAIWLGTVEDQRGEAGVLTFLDKAIACDPENAWFYYRKADYMISLGEIEQARELLRRGNASPKLYTPLPFPTSEAYRRLGRAKSGAQKAAIGYMVDLNNVQFPNYIRMKEAYKNAEVAFALGYTLEFADELLTRARRLGQETNQMAPSSQVAAVLAQLMLKNVNEQQIDLTPAQEKEYQAIVSQLDSVETTDQEAQSTVDAKLGKSQRLTWPSGFNKPPTREDCIRNYEAELILRRHRAQYAAHFDCLDPPPLAVWASGRLRSDVVDSR